MAQVVLQDITKIYPGGVEAVKNVSLEIKDQEFIVLVGPSGCGKTTTLRMIAGLEEITQGNISIGGRVVNHVPPKDRDIAMVFQNYALYPHMTVYKNMAFGLKLRKYPKKEIEQRVQQTAKMLGIQDLLNRKPKQLSGGQRQRVAVGRAIVREPKAFLFDEPLSNLDAKMRVETRAELKKLHRQLKTTTIYVTHDQEEAMTLGDRVVVMNDGIIHQCDRPLTVYDRPVDRFVAGFLGTPAMNFFSGRIIFGAGRCYFDQGTARIGLPDRWNDLLPGYENKEMILGVRPESFSPKPQGVFAGKENCIKVKIEVIEPLGNKQDVYARLGDGERIVCRIDSHIDLQENVEMPMYIDIMKTHIFEPGQMGQNVTLDGTASGN